MQIVLSISCVFHFFLLFMCMDTEKQEYKTAQINVRLPESLKEKYKIHCSKSNSVLSERIRKFIELDLNNEIKQF